MSLELAAATRSRPAAQYSNVDDFGLMYYNARWYDPVLGRFAQADTVVPDGPQGYDRYAYVGNNPVNNVDPSGHREVCGVLGEACESRRDLSDFEGAEGERRRDVVGLPTPPALVPQGTPPPIQIAPPNTYASGTPPAMTSVPAIISTLTPTPPPGWVPPGTPHVTVDWSKVDKLQAAIDIAGIGADAALIAAGAGPGAAVEAVTTGIEGVAAVKAGYDAVAEGDLQGLSIEEMAYSLEHNPILIARMGRWVPLAGSLGSAYSLYDNFAHATTLTYTIP